MCPALSCAMAPCVPPKLVSAGSAPQPDTTSYVHAPFPVSTAPGERCSRPLTSTFGCASIENMVAHAAVPAHAINARRDWLGRFLLINCSLPLRHQLPQPYRINRDGAG